jgi:hypothetical protein
MEEDSTTIRVRVVAARTRQQLRFGNKPANMQCPDGAARVEKPLCA